MLIGACNPIPTLSPNRANSAPVRPEYCVEMSEAEVTESAFELMFAFDEIVALGYRENVNISQIRTFIEMDSHDENIAIMVKRNKENEQKEVAKRRAKELRDIKRHTAGGSGGGIGSNMGANIGGGGGMGMGSGGGGGGYGGSAGASASASADSKYLGAVPTPSMSKPKSKKGGMRLGKKGKKDNEFVEQLMAEGQAVTDDAPGDESSAPQGGSSMTARASSHGASKPEVAHEGVHLNVAEKITVEASRDGGVENFEVKGIINMLVSDQDMAEVKVKLNMESGRKIPFQTHPNVDKKQFKQNVIALKSGRPFPVGTEVGVVKWRFQSTDEEDIPLTVNCWPTVNNDGSANLNIDYELVNTDLVLEDVSISLPVPSAPVVGSIDGDYHYDRREGTFEWSNAQVSEDNAEGSLEFSVKDVGSADDFFPVTVNFTCKTTFAGISIETVVGLADDEDVTFSQETCLETDSYEYV